MVSTSIPGRHAPLETGAIGDLAEGLFNYRLWGRLGWLEIKRRYRRTVIGPFWSGISFAVLIGMFGAVGAGLWQQPLGDFIVFLAAGMIAWLLMAAMLSESGSVFIAGAGIIREIRINYSILIYALVWRNLLVFLHQLAIFAIIFALCSRRGPDWNMLLVVPGSCLILLNGAWLALLLGMFTLRFRDMQQVVNNFIQIVLFVTPLFWPPDRLLGTSRGFIVEFNPIYYFVDIIRTPLLGGIPGALSYEVVLATIILGWILTVIVFRRFRARIAYWT